jgi:peptide/nickel transport system permease protein
MARFIIRRLLLVPFLLLGMTVILFGMLQFVDPVARSALYVRDFPRSEGQIEGVIKQYGFDQPLYKQYWTWLVGRVDKTSGEREGGVLFGDFGYSRSASEPVIDIIKERFPNTLDLTLWSLLPVFSVGIWLGVQAAVHQNGWIDRLVRVFSVSGASIPLFVFGLLCVMIFYAKLGWFPPGRMSDWVSQLIHAGQFHQYTRLLSIDALLNGRLDVFWDAMRHMILPVLTLSVFSWASFVRVTRSSMLETLNADYVTAARARGIKEKNVIRRHAKPNAMIPIVTLGGLQVVSMLGGVVITETVFNYPGIGEAAATAAVNLDVVTVLGLALFNGLILILANLIVDLLYGFVDPRIRVS